jgi:hypothetical protein
MLSLIKKLFAKKAEVVVTPWPFPTGTIKNPESSDETAVIAPVAKTVAEPAVIAPVSKPVTKPKVVAKISTRKPRTKKVQ